MNEQKTGCKPLWALIATMPQVYCFNCCNPKCSFARKDWDISQWPTIKKQGKQVNPPAMSVIKKQKHQMVPPPIGMAKAHSEGSSVPRPMSNPRVPTIHRDDPQATTVRMEGTSRTALEPFTGPSSGSRTIGGSSVDASNDWMGNHQSFYLADICPYEDTLTSPRCTLTSVRTAISKLVCIRSNEQSTVSAFDQVVTSREPIIDDLLLRLHGELERMVTSQTEHGRNVQVEDRGALDPDRKVGDKPGE